MLAVVLASLDAAVALVVRALLGGGGAEVRVVVLLATVLLARGVTNLGVGATTQLGREAYASSLRHATLGWLVGSSREEGRATELAHDLVELHPRALAHVQMRASMLSWSVQALLLSGASVYIAPRVAPLALGALAVVGVAVALVGRRLSARAALVVSAHQAFLRDVQRIVSTMPVVRALRLQGPELARASSRIDEHARGARRLAGYSAMLGALPTLVGAPVIALVLGAALAAGLAPSSAVALVLVLVRLVLVGSGLASTWATLRATRDAHRRATTRLGGLEPHTWHRVPRSASGKAPRLELRGITIRSGERTLVADLSVDVEPGSHLVLVGPTGAGKTTLLEVILGTRAADDGAVVIGGEPPDEYVRRHRVGYLGSRPCLFAGTLRENLALGADDLDDVALRTAMQDASAEDILERLGLDGALGEDGAPLSSGERQRVGLARALAGAPRLLVLDEPTAHVDAGTESAVFASVARLRGRTTCIIATHRRELPEDAGRVITLGPPGAS